MGTCDRVSGTPHPPDFISLALHRDGEHRAERWVRWLFVAALTALVAAALADVFGQRPVTRRVTESGATLQVDAPDAVRGGLLFQGRVAIHALRTIDRPTLVLDAGWLDGITLNTVEPQPTTTRSERGGVAFRFDRLDAGRTLTVYYEFQVNPTTVGRRSQDVVLRDGDSRLATLTRRMTVYP
jgi:hypothetical protein